MSCRSVDNIAPKNGTVINITGMTIEPYTQTVTGSVVVGTTTTAVTQTSVATLIGGVVHLNMQAITFTNISAATEIATCTLLTGDLIPFTDKYFPVIISMSGTKASGLIKIAATTGKVSYYPTATGTAGWTGSSAVGIVYTCVLRYTLA